MSILKIIAHSILFMILQPGFLINLYPGNKGFFLSEQTNYISIILHTFVLSFILISFEERRTLDPKKIMTELTRIETRDLIPITTLILFILLSPGLLFKFPPESSSLFFSLETSHLSVIIHTLIFIFTFGVSVIFIDKYKDKIKI